MKTKRNEKLPFRDSNLIRDEVPDDVTERLTISAFVISFIAETIHTKVVMGLHIA